MRTHLVPLVAVLVPLGLAVGCRRQAPAPPDADPPAPVAGAASTSMPDPSPPPALPALTRVVAFPALKFERPVFLTHAPDRDDRVWVCEQKGRVWVFENKADIAPEARRLALDLSEVVLAPGNRSYGGNEEGLLGLAFHPQVAQNHRVYLYYSVASPGFGGAKDRGHRHGRLSCFTLAADGWSIDRASEEILAEVEEPEPNHNGGMLAFGPDGKLYWGLGDGGGSGDRHGDLGNAQNPQVLLGKILRLDVDRRDVPNHLAYAVPADNPFVGRPLFCGEIWALGLRNPWRFSFDAKTGDLWCGDVGQNKEEEVDLIVRGGNYGWRVREGSRPFAGRERPATEPLIEPVASYGREAGMSVTGGYVYRGRAVPELQGWYIYGDFVTGRLWALRRSVRAGGHRIEGPTPLPFTIGTLSSFGEDAQGELYACSFDGRIYRLAAAAVRPREE